MIGEGADVYSSRMASRLSSSSFISNSLVTMSNVSPPSIASANPEIVNGMRWSVIRSCETDVLVQRAEEKTPWEKGKEEKRTWGKLYVRIFSLRSVPRTWLRRTERRASISALSRRSIRRARRTR